MTKKGKAVAPSLLSFGFFCCSKVMTQFRSPRPPPPSTVKAFQGKNTNNNNKTKIEHHDTPTKINSLTPKCELMYKFSSLLNI